MPARYRTGVKAVSWLRAAAPEKLFCLQSPPACRTQPRGAFRMPANYASKKTNWARAVDCFPKSKYYQSKTIPNPT